MSRPAGIVETKPRYRVTRGELLQRIGRLQSLGVLARSADKVLAAMGDSEYMVRILSKLEQEGEYGKCWDAIAFLLQMRDGRPAQQINITSMNVNISPEEIARTKSIVNSLRFAQQPPSDSDNTDRPQLTAGLDATDRVVGTSEETAKHNAVPGQGVKRGGMEVAGVVVNPLK